MPNKPNSRNVFYRSSLFLVLTWIIILGFMPIRAHAWIHYLNVYPEVIPDINWFQLSEMYAPNTMKFEWNASAKSSIPSDHDHDIVCQLNRVGGGYSSGNINSTQGTYHYTAVDQNGFTSNTPYQYQVKVLAGGAPAPHVDEQCNNQNCTATSHEYIYNHWWNERTATINVTPIKIYPNHNQSVDSRLDTRYADNHFLDFQFGSRIYKGGLFVGNALDGSKIGRTFIKHQMTISLPTNDNLWAGSFNAWYTGSDTDGTTTVACIPVSDVWTQQTIVWSTAPSINPSQATNGIAITYDDTPINPPDQTPTHRDPRWISWPMDHELTNALRSVNPTKFAVALASTNESSRGWAYFAKPEYDATKRPILLYATKEPLFVTDLTITPGSLVGGNGNTATGTVTLNWPATGTGFTVELKLQACGAYPAPLSFPSSVTIPAGSTSATFTINTTYPSAFSVTATIRAGENVLSSTTPMYFKDKDMYIRQM